MNVRVDVKERAVAVDDSKWTCRSPRDISVALHFQHRHRLGGRWEFSFIDQWPLLPSVRVGAAALEAARERWQRDPGIERSCEEAEGFGRVLNLDGLAKDLDGGWHWPKNLTNKY